MTGPLGNTWSYGWYNGWIRGVNEGWFSSTTWIWDIVATNVSWSGWIVSWYYGWELDWYFDWSLAATTSWEYGWNVGWFSWGGSWSYGWNVGWFAGVSWGWIGWTYGWTLDWLYGWNYVSDVGWGVEYGWVPQTSWSYGSFFAFYDNPELLNPWYYSWLNAETDYGWFLGWFLDYSLPGNDGPFPWLYF
ncbi:MAG: hypothetical protein AAF903_14535 [Pseudomonadota bacterium]